ncbi:hypothetical protein [sulfur-oxidizing endosymbiont of Gigantopelta aegis]|uniref:hypothetical protein n=1 Tax=sulfur-oxidizing endosymbiont of Gigantopelta aegis TaxID=2794934 RepID=UPI0018DEC57F|nr:hypothetical protein [sulfur-oxidizing endosymbiont of Gigantopelta aegis]
MGRNDPYISREARQNIAQAYYTQARQLFVSKEYKQTLDIVASGLKFEAQHSGLRALKKKAIKQYKILENSLIVAKKLRLRSKLKKKISR